MYRQSSNMSHNTIVDHSDVVGACRQYSNYIFIHDLTPGFDGLGKDKDDTRNI